MRIMTITEQGLRWIAALVLVLWGCIVTEDTIVKHARHETVQALIEIRHMREGQRPVPASRPVPIPALVTKPAIG